MNDENEFSPALAPWLNEPKTFNEIETLDEERIKYPVAAIYRRAEEIVLDQLANSIEQKWKLNGIKEDLAAHRDSTLTDWFAKEVIALAEKQMQ